MGRTLEFKSEDALKKAMHLFWEKGYEHTSLADLLEVMKVGNGSSYNSFGNKGHKSIECVRRPFWRCS